MGRRSLVQLLKIGHCWCDLPRHVVDQEKDVYISEELQAILMKLPFHVSTPFSFSLHAVKMYGPLSGAFWICCRMKDDLLFCSCISSSRSSDGNSSLPDEGGSASQVPQASAAFNLMHLMSVCHQTWNRRWERQKSNIQSVFKGNVALLYSVGVGADCVECFLELVSFAHGWFCVGLEQ